MLASKAPVRPRSHGQVRERGSRRGAVAQHHGARVQILVGHDGDRHRLSRLSRAHGLVHQRLFGRQVVGVAVGEPRDRFVERPLDVGVREPGAEPHLGLDLQRLAEVFDRLLPLLEPTQRHDPQRHEGPRADRVLRQPGALRQIQRLVQEPHRGIELEAVIRLDGLAIEQRDLADRRAISVLRQRKRRHEQHRDQRCDQQRPGAITKGPHPSTVTPNAIPRTDLKFPRRDFVPLPRAPARIETHKHRAPLAGRAQRGYPVRMANVAEAIVDTLVAANVRRIYGVVGDSLNALTRPCADRRRSNGSASATKRSRRSRPAPTRS